MKSRTLKRTAILFLFFAISACSRNYVSWDAATAEVGLSSSTLSPTVGLTTTETITGGVQPYSITLSGPGSFTTPDSQTILFQRPWSLGTSQISVTDYFGHKTSSTLTLSGGAVQIGGGGAPLTDTTTMTIDLTGSIFVMGSTQAVMPGLLVGSPGNVYAFIAKISSTGQVLWVSQIGGGTSSTTTAVQMLQDSSGNSFVLGTTDGDLGGFYSGSALSNIDSFVAKFSPTGSLLWVRQIGGGGATTSPATQLLFDSTSNPIFLGTTTGSMGGTVIGSHGATDAFIVKYNSNGTFAWASQIGGGTTTNTQGLHLSIDTTNGLYLRGTCEGNLGGTQIGVHGAIDSFIAKLTSAGALSWLDQLGGGAATITNSTRILLDPLHVGYSFLIGTTFGSLGGTQSGSHGAQDTYVAHFNATGALLFVNQIGGGGASVTVPVTVTINPAGEAFLLGTTDADLTPLSTQFGTHGSPDMYVAKLSAAGALSWISQMGGGATTTPISLSLDGALIDVSGYVAGNIGGTQIGSIGNIDSFIGQFSATGVLNWVDQIGGGGVATTQSVQQLIDSGHNILLAAQTSGSLGGNQAGTHGAIDSVLMKITSAGALSWVTQFGGGGSSNTFSSQILQDAIGNTYLMGKATRNLVGTLFGPDNFENAYIAKFSTAGILQ